MKTNGRKIKSGKVIQAKKISTDKIMIILFISVSLCSTILFLFLHHYFYTPKAEDKVVPQSINIQIASETTQYTQPSFTTDTLILFNKSLLNTMGKPMEYNTWLEVLTKVSHYYPTAGGMYNQSKALFAYSKGFISTHIALPNKELLITPSVVEFVRVCNFVLTEANSSLFEYKSFGGSIVYDDILFTRLWFQHVYLHPLIDIILLANVFRRNSLDKILKEANKNKAMKEPLSNYYHKLLEIAKYMFLEMNKSIETKENEGIFIWNLIDGLKPLRSLAEMYRYLVVILMLEKDGEKGSIKLNETIENELKMATNKGNKIEITEKENEKRKEIQDIKENIKKHCFGVFDDVDFTKLGEYKQPYSIVGFDCLKHLGSLIDYLLIL